MYSLLLATATLAAAIWSGAIVFQSFVVAPTVFDSLDVHQARRFLRSIFPRFYWLGLIAGSLLLSGVAGLGFLTGWPEGFRWLTAFASTMLVSVSVSLWMVPRINTARDQGISGQQRFRRLHKVSVLLTVLILILAIASLVVLTGSDLLSA